MGGRIDDVSSGITRLLLRVVKFVVVPIGLLLAGYLIVGPMVSDYLNESDAANSPRGKAIENPDSGG
ncbi:MAG: hypothetical protein ACR2HJ_12960 [Fimbriimonadales bacterium]